MNPPVRVLIVDDDALVRAGLTMMLDGAPGIAVVGEAADGDQVPAAADAHAPDVVLMDLRMPRVNGIVATRRLRARPRPPEIIVLTTFDTDENILTPCVPAPAASSSRTPRRPGSPRRSGRSRPASRSCRRGSPAG